MNATITALVFIAVLATMLALSPVLLSLDDADARQYLKQKNRNCGNCANAASQIEGDGNNVAISIGQSR
jgi:hypothetical protein